ncbi:nucleoside-diphosphate sugar epimerase [Aliidongia dinghuensis]|uniref:Nucleoside-diphosphate sugar epimerase n=1 Tax=Aliidongia dinghuensis TaxID=1867774 RepID=A0A8J2YW50_9PROT|nr:NAD(P)H-binding protein [Aliidongia dinghuensis]GGF30394.1 nucleoside-diphosphate sugar epimerase [Aliidongia dinghuensis]
MRVTVLAATGRLGQALVRHLRAEGHAVIAVGRDPAKLTTLPEDVVRRVADFGDATALKVALADATCIVSCANAAHVPAILAALPAPLPERLVLMGSTRRFSAVPDATAEHVRRAEALLAELPVPSVMLLASLIYGAGGSVVDGLAARLRRSRFLPLPRGGRSLVQPIHIDDVAAALVAAIVRDAAPGAPIVIAGPAPMSYGAMVRTIARSIGRPVVILALPGWLFSGLGRLLALVPGLAGLGGSLRRLVEDKAYDIGEMRRRLGVSPRAFEIGGPR